MFNVDLEYEQPGTLVPKSVGQYVGVQLDFTRKFPNGRTLRIITYQAYNALGLIGSEYNGVAVLDEDQKAVITDNLFSISSGYCGVGRQAWERAKQMKTMPWEQLEAICVNSERYRGGL